MSILSRVLSWFRAPVNPLAPTPLRWKEAELSRQYVGEIAPALDLPSHCREVDGLLYPDWEAVMDWVEDNVDPNAVDQGELWGDIATAWFQGLCAALVSRPSDGFREGFRLRRSPNFLLLYDMSERHGDLLLTHCERVHAQINEFIGSAALIEGFGPIGIFQACEPADFYRYVDPYMGSQEGQMSSIGGLFIQNGYGHAALNGGYLTTLERTMTHELAHAAVQHQQLPCWLDEALAMGVEGLAHGESIHFQDSSEGHRLVQHWTSDSIQGFWSGESFRDAEKVDDSIDWDASIACLSYALAAALFQFIHKQLSDDPESLARFIDLANFQDAGERAVQECLGTGLGELTSRALGQGDWAPVSAHLAETLTATGYDLDAQES